MKKRIVSLLLALVMAVSLLPVSAFAEDDANDYELRVLTFEDADYKGGTNFAGGSDWSSLIDDPQYGGRLLYGSSGAGVDTPEAAYKWADTNNTGLTHILPNNYNTYCYWGGGHAISNYVSGDSGTYGGFDSQLTVYKKGVSGLSRTGGGHNGSNNFAVHFGYIDGSEYNKTDILPTLTFADGAEHVIDHMFVNVTTYLLNCLVNGNGLTAEIGSDDWVKLVAIGYNAAGTKTGEASIYLCNGPDNIVMDWTKWDLSGLGKVNSVMFNVTGSSDNGYGFSQPAYFAYDDVAVRFEKGSSGEPEQPTEGPITVKVGETACTITKEDSPDSSDAYKVTVDSGDDVTIEVKGAAFLMVNDANYGYLNEEGVNPFALTAAQLDGATLTDKQIANLVKFTPADNSKITYLSIMDAMAGASYHLFIERTVKAVPATGITLDKTELTLRPTEEATLTATVTPENTTDTVVWTSSDDAVATVKDGVITAVKEGTAAITAQCGSVKAECTVTVLPPVLATSVTLDKTALTLYEGDAAKLTATVTPENTTDKTVVWTSSDDAAATVKDGVVTAVKAGTVTITAQCGDVKAQCAVTVKAPAVPSQKDGVYQIGTVDELIWFAKQVNGGNTAISGVLKADIDLGGINWTPIGSYGTAFAGSFDGAGHVISGLTIDYQTAASGERVYLGLFGYVVGTKDKRAAIKDLTVSGSVNAASEFPVYSGDVAGVVGYGNYVDISGVISRINVSVDAKVGNACGVGGLAGALINSTVTNCGNEGNVSGVKNLGGLCYELYAGTMTGCYNTGAVSASGTYVGGVMGYAKQATIKDVYNTGAVSTTKNLVGGLVGVMEKSSLINGYSTGKVTVAESGGNAVGAVVGTADTLSNIYYLAGTADKAVGDGDATAAVKTADELKAKTMPAALGDSFKRDLGGVNGGYPVLTWQTSECTNHTPGDAVKENIKDATCTAAGSHDEVIFCTNCGKELERNNVTDKALGHTEKPAVKENVKDATCTAAGSHDDVVYCSVCQAEISRTTVTDKALGHDWASATGKCTRCDAACDHKWTDGKCDTCGMTCQHTPGTVVKENIQAPTCTADGSHDEVVYCTICKAEVSRTNVVDKAAGHKWNEGVVTTPSTTTAEGVRTFTCTVCQATRTESIPKIPTTPSRPGKPSVPAAKPVQSQKTGDAGIAMYAGLSLLSLTGGAWIIGKKKNED